MKTRQATENRIPTVEKMIIMDVRLAWTVFITMTTLTPSYGMPTVREEEGGWGHRRQERRKGEKREIQYVIFLARERMHLISLKKMITTV